MRTEWTQSSAIAFGSYTRYFLKRIIFNSFVRFPTRVWMCCAKTVALLICLRYEFRAYFDFTSLSFRRFSATVSQFLFLFFFFGLFNTQLSTFMKWTVVRWVHAPAQIKFDRAKKCALDRILFTSISRRFLFHKTVSSSMLSVFVCVYMQGALKSVICTTEQQSIWCHER